jgi:hypothetical protein
MEIHQAAFFVSEEGVWGVVGYDFRLMNLHR